MPRLTWRKKRSSKAITERWYSEIVLTETDRLFFLEISSLVQGNTVSFDTVLTRKVQLYNIELADAASSTRDFTEHNSDEGKDYEEKEEDEDQEEDDNDEDDEDDSQDLFDPDDPPLSQKLFITPDDLNDGELDYLGDSDLEECEEDDEESTDEALVLFTMSQRDEGREEVEETDDDDPIMSQDRVGFTPQECPTIGNDVPEDTLTLDTIILSLKHLIKTFPGGQLAKIDHDSLLTHLPEEIISSLSTEERDQLCIMANRHVDDQGRYTGYDTVALGQHCAHSLNMISKYGPRCKQELRVACDTLIFHLHEKTLKEVVAAIVANNEACAIAIEIIGDKLNEDLNMIGEEYAKGMKNFYENDQSHIVKIITDSGKYAFTKYPDLSILFAKLCVSLKNYLASQYHLLEAKICL